MKTFAKILVPLAFLAMSGAASADPWKDESGKGKRQNHERREFKEEYWDGNCKVEREMKKDGEYKEERKCKPARRVVEREYRVPAREERTYYVQPEPPQSVRVYENRKVPVTVDVNIGQ